MKTPLRAPAISDLVAQMHGSRLAEILTAAASPTVRGRYRHWDSLRHLKPPNDWTPEEWWMAIKFARNQAAQPIAVRDGDNEPFRVVLTNSTLEMLHLIDKSASGRIAVPEVVTTPGSTRRYLVDSLIEEAITSSQLEGASTTRRVAKEMIRSGRNPTTRSERMILNNYRAMRYVSEHHEEPLTYEFIMRLHSIVTDGTLDNSDAAGRPQRVDEERVVVQDETGELLHVPPPAEQLADRLSDLCHFANGNETAAAFIHPVVRAIAVHFKLGYDHPFEDGNGRTARVLFYWAMLHYGYWLIEYLPISRILKAAPARYARSFLYAEQDDNDLTYFILYQLGVITRAIDDMHDWLSRKVQEVRETEALLRSWKLNHRQSALLGNALRNPDASYTYRSHATSHDVTHQSARTDLIALREMGLLAMRKIGKQHVYTPVKQLPDLIRDLNDE